MVVKCQYQVMGSKTPQNFSWFTLIRRELLDFIFFVQSYHSTYNSN